MKSIIALIALAGAGLSSPLHAALVATSAASSSSNIEVTAIAQGVINSVPLGFIDTFSIVNGVTGAAPGPYLLTATPLYSGQTAMFGGPVLTTLTSTVSSTGSTVYSDVNGLPGPRSATAISDITQASSNVRLDGIPYELVNLGMTALPGPADSTSSILWDGVTLTPFASSDFLNQGGSVVLSVLGYSLSVPTLFAGMENTIPVSLTVDGITATGNIYLTADKTNAWVAGNTAYAEATSLSARVDLHFDSQDFDVAFNSTLEFNKTSATLSVGEQSVTVPDGGETLVLMSVGLAGMVVLRQRMA